MNGRRSLIIGVIDDDEAVLKGISRLLRACGYDVCGFSSAQQFLEQGEDIDRRIACLIVDVHMPGRSGLELVAELERAERIVPVVVMTGAADAKRCSRAAPDGVVVVLQKPFTEDELLRAIATAVEQGAERARKEGGVQLRTN